MRSPHDDPDALFRAAFEANPMGMALVERGADGRHTIVAANPALGTIFRSSERDLITRPVDDLLIELDSSTIYADGWHEQRRTRPDGSSDWIRWHLARLPATSGERPRYLVQVDVITKRVEARRQAQRQTRILDLIPEPVIIRTLDGTILYWNSGAAEIYGYPADVALGQRTHDLLQTDFGDISLHELEQQLSKDGSWQGQLEHRHADGRTLRMASKHVRDEHEDGQPVILEINVDITDRLAAEEALAASETKFRSQFANSTVGQLIRRVDGTIEEINPALADMLGYAPGELVGTSADRIFSPTATERRRLAVDALLTGKIDAITGETTLIRADGTVLDSEVNVTLVRGTNGDTDRIIGIYQDITARKVVQNTLAYQASHDPLTGLANRALLLERITDAFATARKTDSTIGLLYLDLDGFKAVNDDYGHDAGDALLKEVARRLVECMRGGDTIARLGGDEFVVLCPDLDSPARLHAVAQRVLAKLGTAYMVFGRRVDTVTASIGISYPSPYEDVTDALRNADQAMYEVKKSGKNRIGLHVA